MKTLSLLTVSMLCVIGINHGSAQTELSKPISSRPKELAPAFGSTGGWLPSSTDFSIPPLQLRTRLALDLPAASAPRGPVEIAKTDPAPADKQLSAETPAEGLHTYAIRDDRFYLVPTFKPKATDFLSRTFEPEVVHIGKHTELSCSVVTAVKRKNPLCLLNPMFFNLSW